MLPLPGGAGLSPVLGSARRLADFTLPRGTFKRFDLEQVVRLLLDVLSGVMALHEVVTDGQAFVHGDVSPQTIYVDEHGTARLVPLLNAHSTVGAQPEVTGYAAPERRSGLVLDVRADVYSVGVMLWEALAGKRLSFAREPLQLPARLGWAKPLCAIAERAIARDPALRFRSAFELSQAIATAVAPQLSRLDLDAWQEEAPTPVFQPRLHLATLRNSTPPPAVLSLVETAPPTVATSTPPPGAAPATSQALRVGKRGAAWVVVPALAAAGIAVALAVLVKSPALGRRMAAAAAPAVLLAPASPAAKAPPALATSPNVAVAPVSNVAVSSALPNLSAASPEAPAPSARANRPQLASTPTPSPVKAKPKPHSSDSDYGI